MRENLMIFGLILVVGLGTSFAIRQCTLEIKATNQDKKLCAPYALNSHFYRGDKRFVACGNDEIREVVKK